MKKFIVPYRSLAQIDGSDYIAPLYLTTEKETSLCNCINGFADNGIGCDILTINNKIDFDKPYISMINKYGFIKAVYGEKEVKRHISNISDIKGIFMTEELQDIVNLGELGVKIVKHRFTMNSSECFVVKTYSDDKVGYIGLDGMFTTDITKAWFTFDKEQANKYAGRMLLKDMRIYEVASVDNEVSLIIYEMED